MSPELDQALKRLGAAIGQLDTTVGRYFDVDGRRNDLETELQLMQDDRARLAVELESATARLNKLETAADHVGQRVHGAIGTVRAILARSDSPIVQTVGKG